MLRQILLAKIHRATVTDTNLEYEGSLSLDSTLMDRAGLVPFERVFVVNVNNGARFDTYLQRAEPDGGDVVFNGAAARLGEPGDKVIIMAYAQVEDAALASHRSRLVMVDERNRITEVHE